jgi:protein-tyrosine kinase
VLRANGVMPADASGPAGHAFKMLRTQVLQRMQQQGWNTLAVLSATPKDGKTFVAINLAIAIAGDTNHTALLVDFDLRNPSVHQRFGIQPEIGIEQCLRGEASVAEALDQPAGLSQAAAAARAREPVSNSSESALQRTHAAGSFAKLKTATPTAWCLFDLPPVLGADDALAFAPQVDAALVVVAKSTRAARICCAALRSCATFQSSARCSTDRAPIPAIAYAY